MGHYRANLRDIEFMLFEVLRRGDLLGTEPFADLDEDTARSLLSEVTHLAETDLAASFADSDRNPPRFDPQTHTVTLPDSFKQSYARFVEGGWPLIDLPTELGGNPVPDSLRWAVNELVLGANPAIHIYATGYLFAHVLYRLGTEEQQRWASTWARSGWGGTMVLTEPDAGSDVGSARTTATQQPDGSWHLEGVKRFITSGEHDLTDNIVHLVLARPKGAGPGTKGLSLFVVPKFLVNWETGELGARNGVYATNLEHKMGIRVSATCELTFGENEPAVGWLVGEVHDGIAQMFTIIEYARMMVGTKAIATLSTGYLNALEYAKVRVQGADLTQSTDKTAPRVTITHHPDVRRSLLTQKAYAEGMRALVLYTASIHDDVALRQLRGEDTAADEALIDLLLPIVKGYGSEKSYALLGSESLQTFGGSGYLQDYPLEQYVRDSKIDTLYEGTTAIQGMDLFFRKMVRDNFAAVTALGEQVALTTKASEGDDPFGRERALLATALDDVQNMIGTVAGFALASQTQDIHQLYRVGQNTTRLLLCVGDLLVGWLLLRQAEVAHQALSTAQGVDVDFYTGKIAAARWFAQQVLPTLTAQRAILEATDDALMEIPESAF